MLFVHFTENRVTSNDWARYCHFIVRTSFDCARGVSFRVGCCRFGSLSNYSKQVTCLHSQSTSFGMRLELLAQLQRSYMCFQPLRRWFLVMPLVDDMWNSAVVVLPFISLLIPLLRRTFQWLYHGSEGVFRGAVCTRLGQNEGRSTESDPRATAPLIKN